MAAQGLGQLPWIANPPEYLAAVAQQWAKRLQLLDELGVILQAASVHPGGLRASRQHNARALGVVGQSNGRAAGLQIGVGKQVGGQRAKACPQGGLGRCPNAGTEDHQIAITAGSRAPRPLLMRHGGVPALAARRFPLMTRRS